MDRPNFCPNEAQTVIISLTDNDNMKKDQTMPICFHHARSLGKEIGRGDYKDFDIAESFDFREKTYCYWELDFPATLPL